MQTNSLTANKVFIKFYQIPPFVLDKSTRSLLEPFQYFILITKFPFYFGRKKRGTETKIMCARFVLLNYKPHDVFLFGYKRIFICMVTCSPVVLVRRATSAYRLDISDANWLDIRPFHSIFLSINIKYFECKSFF